MSCLGQPIAYLKMFLNCSIFTQFQISVSILAFFNYAQNSEPFSVFWLVELRPGLICDTKETHYSSRQIWIKCWQTWLTSLVGVGPYSFHSACDNLKISIGCHGSVAINHSSEDRLLHHTDNKSGRHHVNLSYASSQIFHNWYKLLE
jgi:hypothetical protein